MRVSKNIMSATVAPLLERQVAGELVESQNGSMRDTNGTLCFSAAFEFFHEDEKSIREAVEKVAELLDTEKLIASASQETSVSPRPSIH